MLLLIDRNLLGGSELRADCRLLMEGFSGTDSTDAKREAVPNFYSVYLKSEVRSEQDSNVYGD